MDGTWLDLHAIGCLVVLTERSDDVGAALVNPSDVPLMVEVVRRLEDDLDLSLVLWSRWPLQPTPAGAALLELAEALMHDADVWWSSVALLRRGHIPAGHHRRE